MSAIKVIVAVKDLAAQAFGQPFFVSSTGLALRSFRDEVNRRADDNQMSRHPEDFELYCIGTYDDESGAVAPRGPELVARAKDLVDPVQ